jgi:hypothetical protein
MQSKSRDFGRSSPLVTGFAQAFAPAVIGAANPRATGFEANVRETKLREGTRTDRGRTHLRMFDSLRQIDRGGELWKCLF